MRTRVAHNIKEHKFVDQTVNDSRQAEPAGSLYHTDVRASKVNEQASATALKFFDNAMPSLHEPKPKPEITDRSEA